MKCINVMFFRNGVLEENKLFFALHDDETIEQKTVEAAESYFKQKARSIYSEVSEETLFNALDSGSFEDMGGREVVISWPEEVMVPDDLEDDSTEE